jgi:hypothetical protein
MGDIKLGPIHAVHDGVWLSGERTAFLASGVVQTSTVAGRDLDRQKVFRICGQ